MERRGGLVGADILCLSLVGQAVDMARLRPAVPAGREGVTSRTQEPVAEVCR